MDEKALFLLPTEQEKITMLCCAFFQWELLEGDIGYGVFCLGLIDANYPDEEMHFVLLPYKHMLDRGSIGDRIGFCNRKRPRQALKIKIAGSSIGRDIKPIICRDIDGSGHRRPIRIFAST